jgi:hypothetical protein
MRAAGLFLCLLPLLLLSGCRNELPVIEATDWELLRIQDPADGTVIERLSLFLRVEDGDGPQDVDEIYIVHPESRLYWSLTAADWEERERNGLRWVGSSRLAGIGRLPRGEYRLLAADRAGGESEERIYLDLPAVREEENELFPGLIPDEGGLRITPVHPGGYRILAENSVGHLVLSLEVDSDRLGREEIAPHSFEEDLSWYIFLFRADTGWYAGSGPYRFSEFR